MPLWVYSAIYGLVIVVTIASGVWLLLHLTALARTFAGTADIVPSPKPARASRRTVGSMLAIFGGGLLLSVAMQILAIAGAANALID
jgi:hypothetical protein